MSFLADGFRTSFEDENGSLKRSRANARILLLLACAGFFCAAAAAPQAGTPTPEVTAGAADAALAAPAASTVAPVDPGVVGNSEKRPASPSVTPGSSVVCTNGTSARATFNQLKQISSTIPQMRVASRLRFLPLNTEADLLAFTSHDPKTRFRILVSPPEDKDVKDPGKSVDSTDVRAEAATTGADGTDFKRLEDSSPKTLIHFTPELPGVWAFWKPTRVFVVSCIGDVPQQYGQFETRVTDQAICRTFAIFLSAAFYFLGVCATFFIHRSQRVYTGKADVARHGLKGTNYASFWRHFNPVVLTAGGNGRGSATKLQVLFFSLVVFGLVSYIWMTTGYLSDLSSTVLLLMGISGLGATVSSATDVAKTRLDFDNWAWLINRSWLPKGGVAEVNHAQWKDIVMTDGEFDVYRFQMVTFSVLVGMALLGAGGKMGDLSTFTIPGALLGILGLSQVVYVAGKLAAPPSMAQLNDQISALRKAEVDLQTALTRQELSAASTGTPALPLYRDELASRVGDSFDKYMEAWQTTRTMFESTLSREVSAVAEGCRPPFPYLSAPADVMTILEARFAETAKKLAALMTTLNGQLAAEPAVQTKIDAINQARAAFEAGLQLARESLAKFIQQMKDAGEMGDATSADEANQRARDKAKIEGIVRNALDLARRRLDQLNNLLV